MSGFTFNPPTAEAIAAATQGLHRGVVELRTLVTNLRSVDGCGDFPSGSVIKQTLTTLGDTANQMSLNLSEAIDNYERHVVDAGGLLTAQEVENERNIRKAGEDGELSAAPAWIKDLVPGTQPSPAIPNGPNISDRIDSTLMTNLPKLPTASADAAGKFACGAAPESVYGLTLDICISKLSDADRGVLARLAQQWKQLGTDLTSAVTTFNQIVQMKVASKQWTGNSGAEMHNAATKLVTTSVEISAQASANGAAIVAWAGSLGDTKSYIEQLVASRTTNLATAPPESRAKVQNESDFLARFKIGGTYNPGVTAIANGLSNLTDPSSPTTGVPLIIGGPRGPNPTASAPSGPGSSSTATGVSGTGGSTGGNSSSAGPNKSASDAAAKSLTRQGSGDPAGAAAKNASQSGQGNPASAAQSAMSKAGDTAKGLGGKEGASPLTRSAGLGSLADAEKSAAAKAAAGLGKGGGGGVGGSGGGAGLGKLGGAGIAAAEGSLSARSAAGLSAAERAMAAPQAAPAAARPGMSPGMGGARGAHGGSENEKEHKSARYLISEENGEEIAGELPDAAPPVLGGLNLDTSDNPDTPKPN